MHRERARDAEARRGMGAPTVKLLLALFDEVVATFHHLRAAAERLHRHGAMTAGRRGILRGILRLGPQTVPQLARARPVSRQHVQSLVDELLAEGLVARLKNPAHRRSPLIGMTAAGREALAAMDRRERELLAGLNLGVRRHALEASARTLRQVRAGLKAGLDEWSAGKKDTGAKESRR